MKHKSFLLLLIPFFFLSYCTPKAQEGGSHAKEKLSQTELDKLDKAYFASGCFWCVEAIFEDVKGVKEAVSGYSGGKIKNPTYQEVSSGRTRHAEAVEVYYDADEVDYATLVRVFFGSHDPTTANRQGPDRGPQYRSVAFYQNEAEKQEIKKQISELESSGEFEKGSIVTEVLPFKVFWDAEDYHQDYERKHPENPYVQGVSIPRLRRFQKKFPELLKH